MAWKPQEGCIRVYFERASNKGHCHGMLPGSFLMVISRGPLCSNGTTLFFLQRARLVLISESLFLLLPRIFTLSSWPGHLSNSKPLLRCHPTREATYTSLCSPSQYFAPEHTIHRRGRTVNFTNSSWKGATYLAAEYHYSNFPSTPLGKLCFHASA